MATERKVSDAAAGALEAAIVRAKAEGAFVGVVTSDDERYVVLIPHEEAASLAVHHASALAGGAPLRTKRHSPRVVRQPRLPKLGAKDLKLGRKESDEVVVTEPRKVRTLTDKGALKRADELLARLDEKKAKLPHGI